MRVRVASAGTGKTTSLVRRYLACLQAGEPLRRIAGVTFTRNAAAELRVRVGEGIAALLDDGDFLGLDTLREDARPRLEEARRELDGAVLTTIHGFMIRGLRLSAPLLGLDPDFAPMGEWEARAAFEEELAALRYLHERGGAEAGGAAGEARLAEAYAALGDEARLAEAYAALGDDAEPLALAAFARRSLAEALQPAEGDAAAAALATLFEHAYARLAARLGAARLAPGEIERRALRLVRSPEALARLATRSPRVLVDEFQDVNPLQGHFFEALEAGGVAVEVVGDPKQSIYGFRHADVEVFRRALRRGEVQPPLTETRRHARVPARFLNGLTRACAARGMGFGPDEAPPVAPAGAQAERDGRVEVHWIVGSAPLGALRAQEAEVLAARLRHAHEARDVPYADMAVLARSHAGLAGARDALRRAGVPAVLAQARGYYERIEVRDLVHALRVGVDPSGADLAAWLRSPFAALPLGEVEAVLKEADPVAELEARHPEVAARLARIRAAVRETPLAALKTLIREPFLGGRRYVDALTRHQRENVDALLFTVAQGPPGELEVLLDRLELLSRQVEAGDVPQAGEGVQLLTVHASKGLEWPLVAVFDLGRSDRARPEALYLEDGRLHLRGGPGFEAARAAAAERERDESFRQLYVAASRARDELILTGSLKNDRPQGWARALAAMGLADGARERSDPRFVLARHPYREGPPPPPPPPAAEAPVPEAPSWLDTRFAAGRHPPLQSPSRIREAPKEGPLPDADAEGDDGEPLAGAAAAAGDLLPGRGTVVGTLVHYAISRGWSAGDPEHLQALRTQEVMFPFDEPEREELMADVTGLLEGYEALLGGDLPALDARERDHAEWAVVLPDGALVWEGVIDRLYLADGAWILEDYKTDRSLHPPRYLFQMAVYREAVRRVLGVTPRARLVDLRRRTLLPLADEALEAAWRGRDV